MSTAYPGPNNDRNKSGGSGATNNPYLNAQSPNGPAAQPGQPNQPNQPNQSGQPVSSYHRQVPHGQQQNPHFGGLRNPQQPFQGASQSFGGGPNGPGFPGQLGQPGQPGFQNVPNQQGQANYFNQPGAAGPTPQSGEATKGNGLIIAVAVIGLLVALGALAAVLFFTRGGDGETSTAAEETSSSVQASEDPAESSAAGALGTSETSSARSSSAAAAPADGDVPQEYKDALDEAEIYLKVSSFSKEGLYDMLTFEHIETTFSDEAARYAVDNVEADWKEEALEQAESLREHTELSDEDIYNYLVDQKYGGKFTKEEGDYAMDNLG